MAITNQERVGKAMELLQQGLAPFAEREFRSMYGEKAQNEALNYISDDRINSKKSITDWDVSALLKLLWDAWNVVFSRILGRAERSLVSELRDWRNKWAHQEPFSSDDTERVLDSVNRFLTALSAPQADDVAKMKIELRRLVFEEQVRNEKKKAGGSLVEAAANGTLKPWREIITPHADVASGRYQQAEFAADLWQVYLGEGSDEYRKPVEFFKRTYLTQSLKQLLVGAVQRLSVNSGDPVIQLQTNFGGGKTHSMLALFHLFSGVQPGDLMNVDSVLAEAGVNKLPSTVKRAVLVGNKLSPGNPAKKTDGTVVRTLWGELAWQLGGKKAYDCIKADDEKATSPGDVLRELFNEYGPCLILIDEWVAYARQLHDQNDLPGGSFETMFTFAQALTESVKLAKNCMLVVSLPASDTTGSPHTQTDDVEVGGIRGRDALDRLRNVIGRVESSWRPATAEEGFEIVRRRLFEPIVEPDAYKHRDTTSRAFSELYESQKAEFPMEVRGADYEQRIKMAFPIHPEIFDRLYTDWSSLVKFQRTRGVLRLMAAVIHSLWEKGDKNPIILPSTIPLDDHYVQSELTRYLSDNWVPIIEKDIDGPVSLPLKLDAELPNFGKFNAARRVARTIYLGSAPISSAAHRGIEDRRVKLGCVMPGETPAVFGDALRRLASSATYLYQDGPRVWYSTQPTVTKLADDRAEQLKRDPDKVAHEIEKRLRIDLRETGDFNRTHPLPHSGQEVPDDMDARLVVLSIDHPYSKDAGNTAESAAKSILETRGNSPRLYRNSLVFAAADKVRIQDLDEAARRFLAWESILAEKELLDLSPQQVKQAESQLATADSSVNSRLPETYQWALVPVQQTPQSVVEWRVLKLNNQGPLAVRVSKKLRNDDLLATGYSPTLLRMELDRVPLWRGEYVSIKQLAEDFARYLYLPRLADSSVLLSAIRDGIPLQTWEVDSFAFADSYDETANRFRGLRVMQSVNIADAQSPGIIVKPEIASKQIEQETAQKPSPTGNQTQTNTTGATWQQDTGSSGHSEVSEKNNEHPKPVQPRRFYGAVELDSTRVGRDAGRIAEEVIAHLAGLIGADVKVSLEIEAVVPDGVPDTVIRTVTENSRTLRFKNHGFERE